MLCKEVAGGMEEGAVLVVMSKVMVTGGLRQLELWEELTLLLWWYCLLLADVVGMRDCLVWYPTSQALAQYLSHKWTRKHGNTD